ncbi:MAG TPA: branched-chain amino acid ABC transporter permease [Candidatus Limnocylindrales bacterium]
MKSRRMHVPRFAVIVVVALIFSFVSLGVQQFQNFLTLGAVFALIALGYTMVYGIIELINFAHGDVFMVGAFASMWLLTGPLGLPDQPIDDPIRLTGVLVVVMLVTMVFMGMVGVIIERFAYRPLRHAPRLAPLITAIGVSFILQNIIQSLFSTSPYATPQIFPKFKLELLGGSIGALNIFMVLIAVGLMLALALFVGRTRLGRAMRSTAMDREAAELMGVDINQTIAITFFIAAALAGAAGVIQGLYFGSIQYNLGFNAGLFAFTAAVLGGIGNTTGAAVGGFAIAYIEVGAAQLGYSRWSEVAVFTVLVLVLVFRPSGLLGQALGERA